MMDMPSIQKRRNLVRRMREARYRKDPNRLKEILEAASNPFAGNQATEKTSPSNSNPLPNTITCKDLRACFVRRI